MILVAAVLLAVFVLPSPWGVVAVLLAGVWEIGQVLATIRWSQRRHARAGAEALVGAAGRVVERCDPVGKVAVNGEIWNARCEGGADYDDSVRVRGLQGLTLLVERDQATVKEPASHHST
jgi:membrane protein implicated in regulation of membrane protease activity